MSFILPIMTLVESLNLNNSKTPFSQCSPQGLLTDVKTLQPYDNASAITIPKFSESDGKKINQI